MKLVHMCKSAVVAKNVNSRVSKHEVSPHVSVGLYSLTLADSTFSAQHLVTFFYFQRTVSVAQIASVLQTVPDQYVNEPDDDLKCAICVST